MVNFEYLEKEQQQYLIEIFKDEIPGLLSATPKVRRRRHRRRRKGSSPVPSIT